MPKMTKSQFEEMFREHVLPYVVERYERDGVPDRPARREAWNNTIDAYIRDRRLPEAAGNWSHPRWLETWSPPQRSHARKKSEEDKLIDSWAAAYELVERTKRDPKLRKRADQLDREIAEVLSEGLKVGDAVQFRSEPGTGGVIRRLDSEGAVVATPRGERKVPISGLRRVRKEHESRVRRSVPAHATIAGSKGQTYTVQGHIWNWRDGSKSAFWTRTGLSKSAALKLAAEQRKESGGIATIDPPIQQARPRKTEDIWTVQGNYGHGHVWGDLSSKTTRAEAKQRLKEYRENEPGVPHRLVKQRVKKSA